MPAETNPAPKPPSMTAMASEAGLAAAAIAPAGNTQPGPKTPSFARHGIRSRPRSGRNRPSRQHILHRRIYQHVQNTDQRDAKNQGSWNVPFRTADFSRNHVQVIPAVVSPQGSN